MKKCLNILLICLIIIFISSCKSIDKHNYQELNDATSTLEKNSTELLKSLIELEKENYVDAVFKDEKNIYITKYKVDNTRIKIFLDRVYEYQKRLNQINEVLLAYSSLLLSIATDDISKIQENGIKFVSRVQSVRGKPELNDTQLELLGSLLNEIERVYRIKALEKIIKTNQVLIEEFSKVSLTYITQLENVTYLVYDKRFADVYANYLIEKDKDKLRYLLSLNDTYRKNINYLKNIRNIYEQLPEFHKNMLYDVDFIGYTEHVSKDYFQEDISKWTKHIRKYTEE